MTLKEDFEKAFNEKYGLNPAGKYDTTYQHRAALWATQWILNKISDKWQQGTFSTDELAKMMRELQ